MKKLTSIVFIIAVAAAGLVIVFGTLYRRSPSSAERKQITSPESQSLGEDSAFTVPQLEPDTPSLESGMNSPASVSDAPQPLSESDLLLADLAVDDLFAETFAMIVSEEANYRERNLAVQGLGRDLGEDEVQALYRFLLSGSPESEMLRSRDRALKNDVINRLRVQDEPLANLTEVLVAMFDDTEQDKAVRNYALQQLRAWHERAPFLQHPLILETMERGLAEAGGGIAGTALLAFRQFRQNTDLERTPDSMPAIRADVTQEALNLIHAETAEELSRITAMQVAAEAAPELVFDTAAQWAADLEADYPRRLSAIAALGASGSPGAFDVLARLDNMDDPYLQPAIRTAYRRLAENGLSEELPAQP